MSENKIIPRESGQTSKRSFITRKLEEPYKEEKQMTEQTTQEVVGVAGASSRIKINWQRINWQSVKRNVKRLQARIVKAVQEGRWGKVKA